jgi:hypothetical protein
VSSRSERTSPTMLTAHSLGWYAYAGVSSVYTKASAAVIDRDGVGGGIGGGVERVEGVAADGNNISVRDSIDARRLWLEPRIDDEVRGKTVRTAFTRTS